LLTFAKENLSQIVYARSVNDYNEHRAMPKDKRVKNSCIAVGFKIG